MITPTPLFSNADQMTKLQQIVTNYLRLPFASDTIPGSLLEAAHAHIHQATILHTYDFVDVVSMASKVGWQVKSTKATTPVTWMRAKIPDKPSLIDASKQDDRGCQLLGDAILDYCNAHAAASLDTHQLESIGYARLVLFSTGRVMYFERCLLDTEHPRLWNPSDYVWQWSTPKRAEKKEQLPAFVGRHKETNTKSFAWHGQGENQLHFSGEGDWWPEENSDHRLDFQIPNSNQKVDFETLAVWLSQLPVGDIEASNEVPILSDNNGGTAFPT